MNKTLKTASMGLGGLILFAGTYVGIALISGAPLHEVAGIKLFVDPPEESTVTEQEKPVANVGPAENTKSGAELLTSNAGLLGAFQMAAPFTPSELRSLENELKKKLRDQTVEREALKLRSLELDEWEFSVRERHAELANQRTKLEELEDKIDLRMAELERDESLAKDRTRQGWRNLANVYKGGDAAANSKLILDESPEDAALILLELGAKEAGEILRLINPTNERRKYMDAYRLASSAQAD